jgi:hypothetical protein
MQQQLALVSENALLGLPEAADLLAKRLAADLVGWVAKGSRSAVYGGR